MIHGEGRWTRDKHVKRKRRGWRKFHLGSSNGFIVANLLNEYDGALAWRRTSGYYRQSEVKNMFFRYKKLIGDELRARNEDSRRVESVIACNILNQFRLLGSPQSELIA